MDTEPSLWPGFSGKADDAASSAPLPEDTGREGAAAELRRLLNVSVGNDAGREEAVEAEVGADGGTVLLVCGLPNEKLVLPPLTEVPPKLMPPEGPELGSGRLPNTPVEELPVLGLVAAGGAAVVAVTEDVTGGSACLPNTEGLLNVNPEGMLGVLAGWLLARLVDKALLVGFAASSAWPTRSPEKLPRVSPAKEFGNRNSPSLAGGVSSLLEVAERTIPEGATGLLLGGADSPAAATAAPALLDAGVTPGEELSGMAS